MAPNLTQLALGGCNGHARPLVERSAARLLVGPLAYRAAEAPDREHAEQHDDDGATGDAPTRKPRIG